MHAEEFCEPEQDQVRQLKTHEIDQKNTGCFCQNIAPSCRSGPAHSVTPWKRSRSSWVRSSPMLVTVITASYGPWILWTCLPYRSCGGA